MAAGAALVALAMLVALPGSAGSEVLPREDLAAALAVVLLGLWMMVARRAVLAQVAGFLTAENGLILAAVGARGMPLVAALAVVTLAVAGALVGGVVFLGGRPIRCPDERDFRRAGDGAGTLTLPGLVALVPLVTAAGLAAVADHRLAAWINLAGAAAALALASALPWEPGAGLLLLVDPLAAQWAVLTAFMGLATAWFSRSTIAAEVAAGRLDRPRLRLYHVLCQVALGGMLLALLANNVVVTWASLEAASIALALAVGLGANGHRGGRVVEDARPLRCRPRHGGVRYRRYSTSPLRPRSAPAPRSAWGCRR